MTGAAGRWRFAPGDWYAVVGEEVTIVLPPSERRRVAALWELADAGARADELLDAVLAGGLAGLSDLALVSTADGLTRVLVRGGVTATIEGASGAESVAAEQGAVWSERLVPGRASGRLHLGGADAAADLELGAGLVRVAALEFGELGSAPTAPSEDRPQPVAVPAPTPEPVPEPTPPWETPAEPQAEQPQPERDVPAEPGSHRASQLGIETEVMPTAEPAPPAEPAFASSYEPLVLGEPDDADTGETPVVPDDLGPDRDGQTVAGAVHPPFDRPPIPGQEHAPAVVSAPVATLVFSTGDVVEVDRAVLVGRAPEARRFASHEQPRTVAVLSPHQEISSTHLEIRPGAGADHGSAIVTDLGSTNGTVLVQPGLSPEDLQPGIAVSLIPGAVLDLGDGVTIQVTNP